ncbi:Crp/Fnr family transcriptional regulator [Bradyrhizobium sp. 186]|uniref:Crp/Fnr family transcriptional regulator n=1 Tax=Bradyrhizobium sp. 186 TaxID=2782654 RepID=UPI0020019ABD|nr:Crp/Fnr family transcriptional regulator [Bradyrhizobium sp. 186]UPK36882.1 Crp/Fnr family transcriptional regulator [Bradyrhizobium sp. 186]
MPHQKLIARLRAVVGLSEQDQVRLRRMPYKVRSLGRGEYVVREGEKLSSCIVVMSGFLARQRVVNARNQISSFYLAGDMPDLPSLHLPVADCDLCSVGSSTIASVPHSSLREMMKESCGLTHAFWRETLIHAAIYREWVQNLGSRHALGRVAHLLCELATRMEFVGLVDNLSFRLPLTQQDVADACGLSIVHVNRTIQELRREGLIEWQNQNLTLLRPQELQDVAEFSPEYLHELNPCGGSKLGKAGLGFFGTSPPGLI